MADITLCYQNDPL